MRNGGYSSRKSGRRNNEVEDDRNPLFIIPLALTIILFLTTPPASAQTAPVAQSDVTTPLHALQPDYPVPYGKTSKEQIKAVLDRMHAYLGATTPARMVNRQTREEITDLTRLDENSVFDQGDFRIISYEWGVAYAGMLLAAEATGDKKFTDYTFKRMRFIASLAPHATFRVSNPLKMPSMIPSKPRP